MFSSLVLLAVVSSPAAAAPEAPPPVLIHQGKKELRRQLKERLARIDPQDAEALFAAALWAKRKGLTLDYHRLLLKVVKLDPDHAKARKELGYVKFKGRWVKASRLEEEKKRIEEEEYRRKGYVKYEGAWVKKEDLAYAKLGLVRYQGRWVRKSDYALLSKGFVAHPETGVWIKKELLEKAEKGLFPAGDRWVSKEEAEKYFSSWEHPWVLLSENVRLVTTAPLDKAQGWLNDAETQVTIVKSLLLPPGLPLPQRVTIFAFPEREDYTGFGANYDDTGFSAYGTFYAGRHELKPVAVYMGEKSWSPYYLKHAAGLGVAHMLIQDEKIQPTSWIYTAFGSYLERWGNPVSCQHFGRQYLAKGGIRNLKSFFGSFVISPDQSSQEMDWNIYQAGIFLSYLQRSGDKKLEKYWDKVREAVRKKKGVAKALRSFERALQRKEKQLKSHLAQLVRGR